VTGNKNKVKTSSTKNSQWRDTDSKCQDQEWGSHHQYEDQDGDNTRSRQDEPLHDLITDGIGSILAETRMTSQIRLICFQSVASTKW